MLRSPGVLQGPWAASRPQHGVELQRPSESRVAQTPPSLPQGGSCFQAQPALGRLSWLKGEGPLPTPSALPLVSPQGFTGEVITRSATPRAPIADNQTVSTTLEITEDATVDSLSLDLDISHSYRGDLVVELRSPSGRTATISNKQGGSADDLKGRFDLSAFAGEKATGAWTLTVRDTAAMDTGVLNGWGLTITPSRQEPEPEPTPSDDSDPMKHIAYLSSDEMKGRDSPSPELFAASRYVIDFAKKYGLQGPNSLNSSDPYVQSFDLFKFAGAPDHHSEESEELSVAGQPSDPSKWGSELFSEGFYLEEDMSREALEQVNLRYEELMREAGQPLVPPRDGELRSVEELREVAEFDGKVQNTLALLPGTGPNKDEVIVVMAHLDHVGVGRGGVNNGADDNASGSAVLLAAIPELVEAQKRGELNRSVLFLWTGAEEQGLVGSQYFVDNPIPGLGLDKIQGVINMDMVGRWDDQRVSVIDSNSRGQSNYFREVLEKANGEMADPFDRLNRDINQFRDRQDGAVFLSKGEDVLFVFEGLSNPNGGGVLIPEYHGPGDDIDKIIRDNGGNKPRRVKDLLVNMVELASNRQAPSV